jgi:hypothetical protein
MKDWDYIIVYVDLIVGKVYETRADKYMLEGFEASSFTQVLLVSEARK